LEKKKKKRRKKEEKKTSLFILAVIIVVMPVGMLTKHIIERPRPIIPESDFLIAADSEYAYPSDHALMVSAAATISLALLRNSYKQIAISILLATEAGLVYFSRIYVGGHYPLDILGGILLGAAISFLLVWKQNSLHEYYVLIIRLTRRFVDLFYDQ
jgi:membrane-associated phospholipid phosphatase